MKTSTRYSRKLDKAFSIGSTQNNASLLSKKGNELVDSDKEYFSQWPKNLLSVGSDSKTVKGEKMGFLTGILYLAPANLIARKTICSNAANAECKNPCLNLAGRGVFNSTQKARARKTVLFLKYQHDFMLRIANDIIKLERKAKRDNLIPVVRLNGTSDINFQAIKFMFNGKLANIFDHFSAITFYDYSKYQFKSNHKNYSLTASYSGAASYAVTVQKALDSGINLAAVFRGDLPESFLGLPVIDGDSSDLRFLDSKEHKQQVIVGLKAKGKAKNDLGAFVVDNTSKALVIS